MDPQFDDVLPEDVFVDDPGTGFGAPDPFEVVFSAVPVLFGLFVLLFAAAAVFMIVVATRKSKRYREAGFDPLTADVERDIRVMNALGNRRDQPAPPTTAGTPTLDQRLDDLDRLHRSGRITSAEREAARAKLLGTL